MQSVIQSELLGRHFWISPEGDFASCPTFEDGTPDSDNIDYLDNWEGDDLTIEEFREIISIYQRLVYQKENCRESEGGWGLPDWAYQNTVPV